MFNIYLTLPRLELRGLQALDLRRALGLPDSSELSLYETDSHRVQVDEGFARAYFSPNDVSKGISVPVALFAKGDLYALNGGEATWHSELTDERIMQLFIAALWKGNPK